MSVKCTSLVWEDASITNKSDLLVLLLLADFANDSGFCWPSVNTLALKTRHSDRGVQKILRKLSESNKIRLLERQGPYGTNMYQVLLERVNPVRGRGEPGSGGGEPGGPRRSPDPSGSVIERDVQRELVHLPGGGTGGGGSPPNASASLAEQIYQRYPRKVGKPSALRAITKAMAKHGFEKLLDATTLYAKAREGNDHQFTPHPATWFNDERFENPDHWSRTDSKPAQVNRNINYPAPGTVGGW